MIQTSFVLIHILGVTKFFLLSKEFWELEAVPMICCVEQCNFDIYLCEKAEEYRDETT